MSSTPRQDDQPPAQSDSPDPSTQLARVYLRQPSRPQTGMPVIILGWCIWLIATWLMWLVIESPTVVSARWMLMTSAVGLLVLWPAARLSVFSERGWPGDITVRPVGRARLERLQQQPRPRRRPTGVRLILMEWGCLAVLMVAVVFMLSLHVDLTARHDAWRFGWSLAQTFWLSMTLVCWSAMTGLIVAWAYPSSNAVVRSLAMALCLLLLFGVPLLQLTLPELARALDADALNPFRTIWQLSRPASVVYLDPHPPQILRVGAAAAAGWLVLGLFAAMRSGARQENSTGQ